MSTIKVEVLKCNHCGRLAVALGSTRVTNHKCAGSWTTVLSEEQSKGPLLLAIGGPDTPQHRFGVAVEGFLSVCDAEHVVDPTLSVGFNRGQYTVSIGATVGESEIDVAGRSTALLEATEAALTGFSTNRAEIG